MNKIKSLLLLIALLAPTFITPAEDEVGLRIVRGIVKNSNPYRGSGYKVEHLAKGIYKIIFNKPFRGYPAVVSSSNIGGDYFIPVFNIEKDSFQVRIRTYDRKNIDLKQFSFIAIGPS